MAFQKAIRKQVNLRVALIGPSGSGKTYSALLLATGIGGRIALLDTEHHRSEHYADRFEFDVDHMTAPFTPEAFIEKIRDAESEGYGVLVIDSASHEWIGKGGCLEIVDQLKRTAKNDFTVWGQVTPRHNAFIEAINNSSMHLILCLRGKDEYVQERDEATGKMKVRKLGIGAEMRNGLEYECTTALVLDVADHTFTVSKDNTAVFEGRSAIITKDDGRRLIAWARSGSARVPAVTPIATAEPESLFSVGDIVTVGGRYAVVRAVNDARKPGQVGVQFEDDGAKKWMPEESVLARAAEQPVMATAITEEEDLSL